MSLRRRTAAGRQVLILAFFFFAAAGLSAAAERIRNHFDSDTPMRPPGFFDFTVLGEPGEAKWKVLSDYNPPSAPNQVTQTQLSRPAGSIAAALRRNVALQDGKLSVGLRKGSGEGGLVFRMVGPKDFLLLLVDLKTGQARLASWRAGKVTELARGRAGLEESWGTLEVALSGPDVSALWNGRGLLRGEDSNPAAGQLGLATAGPGIVAFDEFVIEPASEK